MSKSKIAVSKLEGVRNKLLRVLDQVKSVGFGKVTPQAFSEDEVGHLFVQADNLLGILIDEMPDWFGDYRRWDTSAAIVGQSEDGPVFQYARDQIKELVDEIYAVMEMYRDSEKIAVGASPIRSISELVQPALNRLFITHGRSKDWMEVQAYIEKDLKLGTLELAQEPSGGQTIIEKLEANAPKCDGAVIVMSGDDEDGEGQPRVRENVMHEIGYFQAKFGRSRVVLLHQEKVSVPSNLYGIVYVPYPKDYVSAGFALMARELNAMYAR